MSNLRSKFTRWYYNKGYRMKWDNCDFPLGVIGMIFYCPWWVRPLVYYLFSPCVYYREAGYEL
jgi:hypothetical protein